MADLSKSLSTLLADAKAELEVARKAAVVVIDDVETAAGSFEQALLQALVSRLEEAAGALERYLEHQSKPPEDN